MKFDYIFHVHTLQSASLTIPISTAGVHLSHEIAIFAPHKCIMGRRLLPFHEQTNAAPSCPGTHHQKLNPWLCGCLISVHTNHSRITSNYKDNLIFFNLIRIWRTVGSRGNKNYTIQLWCSTLYKPWAARLINFFFLFVNQPHMLWS